MAGDSTEKAGKPQVLSLFNEWIQPTGRSQQPAIIHEPLFFPDEVVVGIGYGRKHVM